MSRPAPSRSSSVRVPPGDRLSYLLIRGVMGAMLALPYRWRVPVMGWIAARIAAPLLGWTRRIENNLSLVLPDLPEAERRRLIRAVPANWGRTLIEIFSGRDFVARVAETPLTGPGVEAFQAACAAGRRVIFVTGHFGNYDAPRAALRARGHPLAALYREARNRPFNRWYAERIAAIGQPVFPATRRGLAGFIKHLRSEGVVGLLVDLHAGHGAPVTFFGKTARTATSAAEWAIKYDAVLIPIYGRRRADGLNFDIILDTPVPHSDPEAMTQALNDSLERMVRQDMDQWFWIHRRWKAAAQTAP